MSLESLLPPEKSEAVIYITPAVTVAVWVTSFFLVPSGLTEFLALSGLIASALALFMSVVNWDVYVLREVLRWRLRKTEADGLEQSIVAFNILLQTWQTSPEDAGHEFVRRTGWIRRREEKVSWLSAWRDNCISDALATYPVRSRTWYWRVSLSFSVAVLLLVGTWGISILLGLEQSFSLAVFSENRDQFWWLLSLLILVVAVVPWLASIWRDYRGGENFTRDIRLVAEFHYLQHLMTIDTIKRTVYYEARFRLGKIKSELDSLRIMLYRGDWSVFVRVWENLRAGLLQDLEEWSQRLILPEMALLLAQTKTMERNRVTAEKQLKLLLRTLRYHEGSQATEKMVEAISEGSGDKVILRPVEVGDLFDKDLRQLLSQVRGDMEVYPYGMGERLLGDTYFTKRMSLHNTLNALGVKLE